MSVTENHLLMNRLYNNRVALNVLAQNVSNAKEVFAAAEGYVLIGILSKSYHSVEEAVGAMKKYGEPIDGAVSVGLGGGDSRQSSVVSEIARHDVGSHINQVFPAVGATRANLAGRPCWINCLVSPTGRAGYVNISTGPVSAASEAANIPVRSAIALTRDMGGNALKFFPMQGLACEEEYRAVAEACGEEQFGLEPTGGIDLDNYETILEIALAANVPYIIPHIYTSIIDAESGDTKVEDVKQLLRMTKKLVDHYA